MRAQPDPSPDDPAVRSGAPLAVVLALWCFGYAGYRAYYAAGGQIGMIGQPVSEAQWRTINAFGAAVILLAGVLALVVVLPPLRRALPTLGWIGGVGCVMHALVDLTLRLLSITGVHPTVLPATVWVTFDRRVSDLQDLFLNEPWFLVTGLLWATLGATCVRATRRRTWAISAVVACLGLTVFGVLSGLGVVGTFHLA